jgi:transcriptional regulator with GAF, ATPase, and Fis domain
VYEIARIQSCTRVARAHRLISVAPAKDRTTNSSLATQTANTENSGWENRGFFAGQTSRYTQTLLAEIKRVAKRPFNILITGETGTGKTYAAREIHRRSARSKEPFMELNCANLPDHLVEAELFGYRKSAFTGASLTAWCSLCGAHFIRS